MSDVRYYLAVDIGASSGRHILGSVQDGKIELEEIHRFWNGNIKKEIKGRTCRVWDSDQLFEEILVGMEKCKAAGKIPCRMGIDTWGVDYALLDENDERVGEVYAYRDSRTDGMERKVYDIIPSRELYERTGIQFAIYNTIFQLMAHKEYVPEDLERAQTLLMVPDYFHFLLTGNKCQEYTEATTSQLVNIETGEWDTELIAKLGLPTRLFHEHLTMPCEEVGHLRPEIRERVGFDCIVTEPATHDTGSAVMSVPAPDGYALYISSGTWSLMGSELAQANCSEASQAANFTNEGGYDHRYRHLKNIMGLWMIQSLKKELEEGYQYPGRTDADDYGFGNLCDMASREDIMSVVPANDSRFLAPESMIAEVQAACRESGQQVPETPWQLARVIYRSLAVCYGDTAKEIEELTGRTFDAINIVGGGSNADWLNRLTADTTGKVVLAGPGEATAIGNLGAQMLADHVFADLADFRKCVYDSFGVKRYDPE